MVRRVWMTAAIFACAVAISGCAFGRKYAYNNGSPHMTSRGPLSVALAVQDQRPAVLTGAKLPTFVGLQRGGFGNPFDVHTVSGQPLADDFVTSIRHGLMRAGYRVVPVPVSGVAAPPQVQEALAKTGAERGLVVLIQEWKSDCQIHIALHYDVMLRVLDVCGQELARATVGGDEVLAGSYSDAEEVVPRVYNRKLEQLLNHPAVVRALTQPPAGPPPASPEAPPATVPPAVPAS
jgi:hypothetical protein